MLLPRKVLRKQVGELFFPGIDPSHNGPLAGRTNALNPESRTKVTQTSSEAILDDSAAEPWADAWHLGETLVDQVFRQSRVQLGRTIAPQKLQLPLYVLYLGLPSSQAIAQVGERGSLLTKVLCPTSGAVIVLRTPANSRLVFDFEDREISTRTKQNQGQSQEARYYHCP